jgi:hypothetical protein
LGPTVSADADARLIDADVDDGVTFSTLVTGFLGSLQLTAQGISLSRPGFASAWIDYDADGIFEATERINITGRIVDGLNSPITFKVPGTAVVDRPVAARVRFSSDFTTIASPTGEAIDGEVEDYLITIGRNPYTNPNNALDVSGDGFVSPIDVLQVVNFINSNGLVTPLTLPPDPLNPLPFLDVNSDGFVGPDDALAIINFINNSLPGGGSEGEGEGSADNRDLWFATTAISQAPATNQPNSASRSGSSEARPQVNRVANASLDDFLASLVNQEMGPIPADDSIDEISSATAQRQREVQQPDWAVALEDVLKDMF